MAGFIDPDDAKREAASREAVKRAAEERAQRDTFSGEALRHGVRVTVTIEGVREDGDLQVIPHLLADAAGVALGRAQAHRRSMALRARRAGRDGDE